VTRIMYRLRRLLRATGPRGAGRSRPQRDKGLTPADVARILNNERFRGKKGGGGGSRGSRGGGGVRDDRWEGGGGVGDG